MPIVMQGVKLMNSILGKSQYAIKGKSIRGHPDAVKIEYVPVTRSILEEQLLILSLKMNMSKVLSDLFEF